MYACFNVRAKKEMKNKYYCCMCVCVVQKIKRNDTRHRKEWWRAGLWLATPAIFTFFCCFSSSLPVFNWNQTIHILDHDKYLYHLSPFLFCVDKRDEETVESCEMKDVKEKISFTNDAMANTKKSAIVWKVLCVCKIILSFHWLLGAHVNP